MIILIEGLDCAGKSTLLELLPPLFHEKGIECVPNKGGMFHGVIDRLAQSMYRWKIKNKYILNIVFALVPVADTLFYTNRILTIQESYFDRMVAFQETFKIRVIPTLFKKIEHRLLKFDMTFYLHVDLDQRRERLSKRAKNNKYDALMHADPKTFALLESKLIERVQRRDHLHFIDTTNLTQDEVLQIVFEKVLERLGDER